MVQMTLKGKKAESMKTKEGYTQREKDSYNRFFINAFVEGELEDILEEGGGVDINNFKTVSRQKMQRKDYWDRMFSKKFTGRDGKVRDSKYNRLGDAIFQNYVKQENVIIREISYKGKEKTFVSKRLVVNRGHSITFNGKLYKGGTFLPKNYFRSGSL